MLCAEFVQRLAGKAGAPVPQILQSLAGALGRACLSRQIENVLVGCRILHDGFRLAVHGESDSKVTPDLWAWQVKRPDGPSPTPKLATDASARYSTAP